MDEFPHCVKQPAGNNLQIPTEDLMASGCDNDDITYKHGRENLPTNPLAKKDIREYYDRFYERTEFKHFNQAVTRRFLLTLVRKAGVRPPASVLDVGCATGFYTEQFRSLGFRATGLDISSIGILKGRKKYPLIPLVVGDAAALPFRRSSFDLLFMYGCSLTNTFDEKAIQDFLVYLTEFVKDTGTVIYIGGSDFSGELPQQSEWIRHSYDQILGYIDRARVDAGKPYITFIRLMAAIGALSLNAPVSSLLRLMPGRKLRYVIYFIKKKQI